MIVSLAEMKSYLGIAGPSQDAFLTAQVGLVTEAIETYCRRKFREANYVQTFYRDEHTAKDKAALFMYPVSAVSSVVEDAVVFTAFRLHGPTGILTRTNSTSFFISKATVITYTAGYSDGNMPLILKNVIFQAVGERYAKKSAGVGLNFGSDVQRISIPGTISIDFDYTLTNNERKTPLGGIIGSYLNQLDYYRSERSVQGSDTLAYNEVAP